MEFFRHCPGCGRRFHIKLVDKKLVEVDRTSVPSRRVANVVGGGYGDTPVLLVHQEGSPVLVDVEEFQYSYKCKHCGHEWSEKHVEEHRER